MSMLGENIGMQRGRGGQMKRAYYLAGAAALAPIAAAGLAPATANAGTAATSHSSGVAARTKTVSMAHSGAPANGPGAVPAAGCTGTNEFYASQVSGDVTLYGWSTKPYRELCIGTVVVNMWFPGNSCKTAYLLVSQKTTGQWRYNQRVCGTKNGWHAADFGIHHEWYLGGVYLSAMSTYGGYATKRFGYGI
jgi:hypothetical protein